MTPSLSVDIAEAILGLHVVVIAFSVFGLVAIPLGAWGGWRGVRVFWWRALHISVLGIVALQAMLGRACFLTIWENDLPSNGSAERSIGLCPCGSLPCST
jgi:uncharacterized protein DUF2784